jgi:hypothetical protein
MPISVWRRPPWPSMIKRSCSLVLLYQDAWEGWRGPSLSLCNIIHLESLSWLSQGRLAIQGMHSYICEDKTSVSFIRLALLMLFQECSEATVHWLKLHGWSRAPQKSGFTEIGRELLGLNHSGWSGTETDRRQWVESMASTSEQVGCLFICSENQHCQTERDGDRVKRIWMHSAMREQGTKWWSTQVQVDLWGSIQYLCNLSLVETLSLGDDHLCH